MSGQPAAPGQDGEQAVRLLAAFDALLTPTGADLLAAAAAAHADGTELRAGSRLRAAGHPPELVAAAFAQAELRARAAAKFSQAERMFFTRAGLEQASSERAATHRAARFAGLGRLADLCTGIGGDLLALAAEHPVLAVDRDPLHLRMAVHNAHVLRGGARENGSGGVEARAADVRDVDLAGVDGVFVDPARRGGERRMSAGAGEPPLAWCFGLTERVEAVAVKAAPGLPVELVPPGWEIEFVADRRGLKESVLFSPALATASRRATVLLGPGDRSVLDTTGPRVATLTGDPDPAGAERDDDSGAGTGTGTGGGGGPSSGGPGGGPVPLPVRPPGEYLFDPNPAVTRAGLVGTLGRLVGGWQIDPRIAFLGADRPLATPFARTLRVEAEMPFDVRRVAAAVRAAGIGALDVRRRGLAGDVDAIRRRLLPARRHLVPGGRTMTVVMTRMRDEPWALLCTDVTQADQAYQSDQTDRTGRADRVAGTRGGPAGD
nr:class I SAM-dependent methyltransferase [Parafrankia discariae]